MDAQDGVHIGLLLGVLDGIGQVLDSYAIELVPDKAHLVVVGMHAACIVRDVPSSGHVLCEAGDIAAVGIHESEVTIGLQQSGGQLCIGVDAGTLGLVGIQL